MVGLAKKSFRMELEHREPMATGRYMVVAIDPETGRNLTADAGESEHIYRSIKEAEETAKGLRLEHPEYRYFIQQETTVGLPLVSKRRERRVIELKDRGLTKLAGDKALAR